MPGKGPFAGSGEAAKEKKPLLERQKKTAILDSAQFLRSIVFMIE